MWEIEYMQAITPFDIVLSLNGHDKGRLFLTIAQDGEYFLLADGKGRKLATPKRKKRKHLQSVGPSAHPAILALQRGEQVTDKQLRCALAAFRESRQPM